jgi:hypothetical protein
LGTVTGIAAALTGLGGTVGTVSGLVVVLAATVTYVVTEGKIDVVSVSKVMSSVKEITEVIENTKGINNQ